MDEFVAGQTTINQIRQQQNIFVSGRKDLKQHEKQPIYMLDAVNSLVSEKLEYGCGYSP